MRLDIVNGHLVTGDGRSFLEDTSVTTEDGLIIDLHRIRHLPYRVYSHRVLDAEGGLILPGLINIHAHVVSFGPLCPGLPREGAPEERIVANLDNHLLQGTTTVLSLDGFGLPFENDAINKIHPVNVKMSTLHTPKNIASGEMGGNRLGPYHRRFAAETAVASGAVAMGEVGSWATTGATYEKNLRLDQPISVSDALALDAAYLSGDTPAMVRIIERAGLGPMTLDEAKTLVRETSVEPMAAAREAILESIDYAPRLGIPALCHTEPDTYDVIGEVAREIGHQMVALHANYHATPEEAIGIAREVRGYGGFVEVITADHFGAGQLEPSPETAFALLAEGLVDALSTDYSGGYHDPILLLIQKAVESGVVSLPQAVRLATSSPSGIVPGMAPGRGLIEPGHVADMVVVDRDDITRVRNVIIGGRIVVEDGRRVSRSGTS